MSSRASAKYRRALAVARLIVAAVLLVNLLAGSVDREEAVSGAELCMMECCAGKAAHLAGECAMGATPACHAHFPVNDAPHIVVQASPDDPICGVDLARYQFLTPRHSPAEPSSKIASLVASSFSQPCRPDCGGALNFSPGQRTNKSAALIAVVRPRPPTDESVAPHRRASASAKAALLKASRPRGPPSFFS